jgi:hypothetical protein
MEWLGEEKHKALDEGRTYNFYLVCTARWYEIITKTGLARMGYGTLAQETWRGDRYGSVNQAD